MTNGFTSLLIDSTATSATASAPLNVTNTLIIASGASLDATALSGGAHAMLGAESFFGSGTLKGSVTTVSGSKVYGGTDGSYGANQITAGLTMATGSTINLDVNTSAAAARHSRTRINSRLLWHQSWRGRRGKRSPLRRSWQQVLARTTSRRFYSTADGAGGR